MKKVSQVKFVTESVRWNEMFESEEELFGKLKEMDIDKLMNGADRSFSYIASFHKKESLKDMTKKQVTQMKRLAKTVYKYHMGW